MWKEKYKMFMKKNIVVQLFNNKIESTKIESNSFFNSFWDKTEGNSNLSGICKKNELKVDLKNKNLYLIIEGEEVYIKNLVIPKVEYEMIHEIIKNELSYYFGKIENMLFTYTIFKENKNDFEILVFCINYDKTSLLEQIIDGSNNIKKISLIQLCFLNYFQKQIDVKNYIFIFVYNNILYLIAVQDNKMIYNNLVREQNFYLKFKKIVFQFIDKFLYLTDKSELEKIYFVNYSDEKTIDELSINFRCKILGNVENRKIIEYFSLNRGN